MSESDNSPSSSSNTESDQNIADSVTEVLPGASLSSLLPSLKVTSTATTTTTTTADPAVDTVLRNSPSLLNTDNALMWAEHVSRSIVSASASQGGPGADDHSHKMELNRLTANRSPIEVTVYNDRQQMVLNKETATCPRDQNLDRMGHSASITSSSSGASPSSSPSYNMLNMSAIPDLYSYRHLYQCHDPIYQTRRGYHTHAPHPYPQSYYQYSAMPSSGNTIRVQPPVKHTRIKPLRRSPVAAISPVSSQKLSPHAPPPISPSFLSPTNNSALSTWSSASEWERITKCTPPSPVITNPPSSLSGLMSPPTPTINGCASDSQWPYYRDPQQLCCGHGVSAPGGHSRAASNGHLSSPPYNATSTNGAASNHSTPSYQHLPAAQSKQQEEYARKLYSLRHALKSDVFMGYGKNTERYELYTDDRPVSPLKLLEIDESLDWSGDIETFTETDMQPEGEEEIFLSIRAMSEALTR